MFRRDTASLAVALSALAFNAAASCGAAFCLANTDWSQQGAWTEPGLRLDLRFEHVDLDQPRSGRDKIAVGAVPRHHDEVDTKNRNFISTLDWSPAPLWGVTAVLPWIDRDHRHIHNHRGTPIPEAWSFDGLGDARVVVRRVLGTDTANPERTSSWGLSAGLKLPTGKHDEANGEGALAERTLQPGTGTTDVLLGAFWHGSAPLAGWGWFARAQAQLPTSERDGFRLGRTLQLDVGVRRELARNVSFLAQVNYLARGRDSGAEAEPEDSGQRIVSLAPGIAWAFARDGQLYALADLPVYQAVNGVQLTARYGFSAGASWRF